jgi:hypothetical protein
MISMFCSLVRLERFNPLSNPMILFLLYIYLFLLSGTLALNEPHFFDRGEQRQLNELLFKGSSESPVPKKIVGLVGNS